MTKKNPYEKPELRTLAIAIALFLIVLAVILPFNGLSPATENSESQLNVLTRLVLISLFIERGTEFFIELWRGSKKDHKKHNVELIQQLLQKVTNDINQKRKLQERLHNKSEDLHQHQIELVRQQLKEVTNDIDEQHKLRDKLLAQLHGKSEDLHQYQAITKRVALWTGFLFGLLMSLAGVRALSSLLSMPAIEYQRMLFRSLDVILTAGLISGGSEGIHPIMTFVKGVLQTNPQK